MQQQQLLLLLLLLPAAYAISCEIDVWQLQWGGPVCRQSIDRYMH